jgi:3-deoxy-D-manno-octulosonate 8-phosphate phosphatase (KDO 8-P phosphatase)
MGLDKIRLVIFDVDGVLTDGRIVLDSEGREMKFFHVQDGSGIALLHEVGIQTALITGRSSPVVDLRARELGIKEVHQNVRNKLAVYLDILQRLGLVDAEVCYMGDDLLDVPILRRAGFSAAPANARQEVKATAQWISKSPGGRGAVRELCDKILQDSGRWERIETRYQL